MSHGPNQNLLMQGDEILSVRQTDRQTGRQTDRQTDRQAETERDRKRQIE